MKKGVTADDEEFKQVDKFIVTSKVLGKGSFGIVYRGFFEKDHSKIVAVKVTPLETFSMIAVSRIA